MKNFNWLILLRFIYCLPFRSREAVIFSIVVLLKILNANLQITLIIAVQCLQITNRRQFYN